MRALQSVFAGGRQALPCDPALLLHLPPRLLFSSQTHEPNKIIFRQLFDQESSTYTYLLADAMTKRALLVDPVISQAQRDKNVMRLLGLDLVKHLSPFALYLSKSRFLTQVGHPRRCIV